MNDSSRRDFLKTISTASAAALALGALPGRASAAVAPRRRGKSVVGLVTPRLEVVRCGVIGLGARGLPTMRELQMIDGCQVTAVCDNYPPALQGALADAAESGRPLPAAIGGSDEAYLKLLARDDVDAVFICTPWRLHVPMAVAALRAGKHGFVEVPAAVTMEDCWQLVETAEETQLHCMMLENVCYGREELMLLRMCREGVFGDLLHGEGAYLHDLRFQMKQVEHGTGSWRLREHEVRNGNLYPTHGLGPICQYMSVNRGDRLARLVSFSSPALGMADYARRNFPEGHPRRTARYIAGDMNTSIVKTARGRTIVVQHDTSNPHPYSRTNLIQGTHGLFAGYPNRINVEGRSPREDEWETDLTSYYAQYEHPLWARVHEVTEKMPEARRGHGGMDFVMRWRIVQCLREGLPLDQDVYDGATWSAVGPASIESVARGGEPVELPDFTRGAWETTPPLGIVT